MSAFDLLFIAISTVFLVSALACAFIMSLLGWDIEAYDRLKTASPRYHSNLKWTGRFNGPLVALMSVAGIIATPFVATKPDGGVLLAVACLAVSIMFLRLSVRWLTWSYRN